MKPLKLTHLLWLMPAFCPVVALANTAGSAIKRIREDARRVVDVIQRMSEAVEMGHPAGR